jgi:DNA-binding response OmpR family regulator
MIMPIDPAAPTGALCNTALIIDADARVRTAIRRVLEAEGMAVIEARNGLEGLRLLERGTPLVTLVVADLAIPFVGNVAVVDVLQRFRPELPLIGTAGRDGIERMALLDTASVPVVRKPFDYETLKLTIRALLRGARAAHDGAAAPHSAAR